MARNLNDTQRLILSAAAARSDLRVLPLPETLRAPAHILKKTLTRMIVEGLLVEITALPGDAVWTASEAGGRVTLVATPAGLAAIGVGPDTAAAAASCDEALTIRRARGGGTKPGKGAKSTREATKGDAGLKQSKQEIVLMLLRRPEGASIAEMVSATGWQQHSVRGFMSGAVKRRLGLEVTSKKGDDGGRRYYIAAPAGDGTEAV